MYSPTAADTAYLSGIGQPGRSLRAGAAVLTLAFHQIMRISDHDPQVRVI